MKTQLKSSVERYASLSWLENTKFFMTFDLFLLTSQEVKTQREDIPEDSVASLQEELAASKLREAESNLALKDLRSKVGDLNTMWLKHIKSSESNSGTPAEMPSTPKKVCKTFCYIKEICKIISI